ncbi:hypothetical protein ACVB8X_43430 [Streptomyces sp. NRAIS4]
MTAPHYDSDQHGAQGKYLRLCRIQVFDYHINMHLGRTIRVAPLWRPKSDDALEGWVSGPVVLLSTT